MNQIFALKSILGKCYEYNITLHQLFIDFKQAYDSTNREKLIIILEEFKIPRKLINLFGMTLRNTTGRVKVQSTMTEEFAINKGLRQGDTQSTQLFNVVLEKVMRHTQINKGGSIYRVSQEECARLREGVPYVKVYRYNPKHLCPNLNGYGDNG